MGFICYPVGHRVIKGIVNEMASLFSNMVNEALDECAPLKSFILRSTYVPGIYTETKNLMSQQDKARQELKQTTG